MTNPTAPAVLFCLFPVTAERAEVKDTHHAGWVAKYKMTPGEGFNLQTMVAAKKTDGLRLEVKHRERTYDPAPRFVKATLHGNTTIANKDGAVSFPLSIALDDLREAGFSVQELLQSCDLRLECSADGSSPAQPSLAELGMGADRGRAAYDEEFEQGEGGDQGDQGEQGGAYDPGAPDGAPVEASGESPDERRKRLARERKQAQRERERGNSASA